MGKTGCVKETNLIHNLLRIVQCKDHVYGPLLNCTMHSLAIDECMGQELKLLYSLSECKMYIDEM